MKRLTPGLLVFTSVLGLFPAEAQQIPDHKYNPPIAHPAFHKEAGPRVSIDAAHHNFHTADGRYQAFAQLLRRDGYIVQSHREPFTAESLKGIEILVISNPIHEQNNQNWILPTPSAYTAEEIEATRSWIENGGSLLLIADHMPFPGGAGELARSFGFIFSNGFAYPGSHVKGKTDLFRTDSGLKEGPITKGRSPGETVTEIATFTGSAFRPPSSAIPIIVFGPGSYSLEPRKAWDFDDTTIKINIEDWCQGAVLKYGKGRVAVFGEAAMFTAQRSGPTKRPMGMSRPEASQNHQLLLNVMHWLSGLLEP